MTTESQFFLPAELMRRAFAVIFDRLDDEIRRAPADASYFEAQRGSFERARDMYERGLYPVALAGNAWLMPSESGPAVVHRVERVQLEGSAAWVWRCGPSCKQRGRFHKHSAYLRVIEQAIELAEAEDVATEPAGPTTWSDGTPIPEEPDPAADDPRNCWYSLPPWLRTRPAAPAPVPMPRLPYARPSSTWQQWRNDEAARPWRAEERARLEQHRARRGAA